MARNAKTVRRERFTPNLPRNTAKLLRAAASSAIKTDLFPALAAGRSLILLNHVLPDFPPPRSGFLIVSFSGSQPGDASDDARAANSFD